jgi:hypothetical protein
MLEFLQHPVDEVGSQKSPFRDRSYRVGADWNVHRYKGYYGFQDPPAAGGPGPFSELPGTPPPRIHHLAGEGRHPGAQMAVNRSPREGT